MFRWLVNAGLLALPIAVTLGILLSLQTHRTATGRPPIFVDNGISKGRYCQTSYGIHPLSKGQEYTLNPNQWGWKKEEGGHLCMNVTSFNNRTYATRTTAPEFSVTWLYPQGPESQPVHAFPNIKVDGSVFPAAIRTIQSVHLDLEWTYGVGNKSVKSTDEVDLDDNNANTNVAIDMFLDSDQVQAQDSAKAKFEIMVWLAAFGAATQPIGLAEGALDTQTLDGTTFNLYAGQNSLEQYVLTWVASEMTEKFHGDISPLIARLTSLKRPNFPKDDDYLGYMGLGSEALYADEPLTFHVPVLSMDIKSSAAAT